MTYINLGLSTNLLCEFGPFCLALNIVHIGEWGGGGGGGGGGEEEVL